MNDLKIFENSEFGSVRVVTGPDGEPWFVAKDVCECLGISNHNDVLSSLDEDEKPPSTLCGAARYTSSAIRL